MPGELALYPFFGCANWAGIISIFRMCNWPEPHGWRGLTSGCPPRQSLFYAVTGLGPRGLLPLREVGWRWWEGRALLLGRLFEIRKGDRAVSNSFENFPWVVGAHSREDLGPALSHPTWGFRAEKRLGAAPPLSAGAAAAPTARSSRRPHSNLSPQLPPSYIWGPLFLPHPYEHFPERHPRPASAPPTPTPLPSVSPSQTAAPRSQVGIGCKVKNLDAAVPGPGPSKPGAGAGSGVGRRNYLSSGKTKGLLGGPQPDRTRSAHRGAMEAQGIGEPVRVCVLEVGEKYQLWCVNYMVPPALILLS